MNEEPSWSVADWTDVDGSIADRVAIPGQLLLPGMPEDPPDPPRPSA